MLSVGTDINGDATTSAVETLDPATAATTTAGGVAAVPAAAAATTSSSSVISQNLGQVGLGDAGSSSSTSTAPPSESGNSPLPPSITSPYIFTHLLIYVEILVPHSNVPRLLHRQRSPDVRLQHFYSLLPDYTTTHRTFKGYRPSLHRVHHVGPFFVEIVRGGRERQAQALDEEWPGRCSRVGALLGFRGSHGVLIRRVTQS